MANILDDLQVKYERNFQIGKYNVDFLVKGCQIIECFGDFWHCNPAIYSADFINKSLKMTAQEKWLKDESRKKTLDVLGNRNTN